MIEYSALIVVLVIILMFIVGKAASWTGKVDSRLDIIEDKLESMRK